MTDVLIATPAGGGQIHALCTEALIRTALALAKAGIAVRAKTVSIADVAMARNFLACHAMEVGASHLLFVDADMSFTAETVERMIQHKLPIIGCVYPTREVDFSRVIELARAQPNAPDEKVVAESQKYVIRELDGSNEPNGDLLPVQSLGMGLCLIEVNVFRTMSQRSEIPRRLKHPLAKSLSGPLFGFFDPIAVRGGYRSEDISFCDRWRQLCDGSIYAMINENVGHVATVTLQHPYAIKRKSASASPGN